MLNVALTPSPSLLWRLKGRKNQLQKVVLRVEVAGPAQLSYKSLCPTWCVNLGTKMLLLGFVSEETAFLMNHCSSTQWYDKSFWWVLAGWSSDCVLRLCQESILTPKFCEIIYFRINHLAHSVLSQLISGRQIWLLMLLVPEMAPRQSCNFIYGMREVEWAAQNWWHL